MKFLEELVGLVNMSRSKPKLVSNVEKIAKSSLASYLFGEMAKEKYIITMRGQDTRRLVTPFEELVTESTLNILARSVARSPWLARRAEEKWRQKESDNLYTSTFKILLEGVAQSPKESYGFGQDRLMGWLLCRPIVDAVRSDEKYRDLARENWTYGGSKRGWLVDVPEHTLDLYFRDTETISFFRSLVYKHGGLVGNIATDEYEVLVEAHDLAMSNNAIKHFNNNLGTVLEERNVGRWAKHIIDHFKEQAIGGDTYDRSA